MELDEIFYGVIRGYRDERVYLESIEKLFNLFGISKEDEIIDVAGGLGFPYLELEKRGYNIFYSDGSSDAFQHVSKKALVPSKCYNLFWHELKRNFGKNRFSYLFCIGQSLPYALSWNKLQGYSPKRYLFRVLLNFSEILKTGGILHVDYAPDPKDDYLFSDSFDLIVHGEKRKEVRTSVILEGNKRKLKFSTADSKIERVGYNVTRNLIVFLAKRAGLELVLEEKLRGDVFNSLFFKKI